MAYYGWRPYVPVAQRRAKAMREVNMLRKGGKKIEPITVEGRKIAHTFWGQAWCHHLEQFSDYKNRLPRGRTYIRNGSVCHLALSKGRIEAMVSGSDLYTVNIRIKPLSATHWKSLCKQCAGQIGSMLELLQGHFSDQVMAVVTERDKGLFPKPKEIAFSCDCPDWADMCKHVAAVLYGIGTRLDQQPELLFMLRGVEHEELISTELDVRAAATGTQKRRRVATGDLAAVFGIEIDNAATPVRKKRAANATAKNKTTKQKPFTPTAAGVARLRKRFGMNRAQFARLLEVSPPAVSHWENGSGKLKLRPENLSALTRVAKLTTAQAQRKLKRLS